MRLTFRHASAAAILLVSQALHAQTRGFVVRLGMDTIAVERFTRRGNTVEGAVARHTPVASILRYTLTFNADSSIASYTEGIFQTDGTPAPPTAQGVAQTAMRMTFARDSVTREVMQNGRVLTKRNAAPGVTVPAIGGTSPYWQEVALQAVRRANATGFGFYTFNPDQNAPNTFDVRIISGDSAEVVFAQGFHRGYKMDRQGQLVHGDASNTTVRLQMTSIRDADIDAIARAWGAKEAAGQGMGAPSTRDSVVTKVGDTHLSIDYGRPAKRGRVIWGKLVPFDTVWRLGANFPTVLTTDRDLRIGGTTVPAGTYSLWLVPSRGQSYLLVNSQTAGWVGVPMHDDARDVARIPVRQHAGSPAGGERFQILIQHDVLMMLWDDGGFEVPLSVASSP